MKRKKLPQDLTRTCFKRYDHLSDDHLRNARVVEIKRRIRQAVDEDGMFTKKVLIPLNVSLDNSVIAIVKDWCLKEKNLVLKYDRIKNRLVITEID